MKFAILDCEDANKWKGHESIWINKLKESEEEIWDVFRVWNGELPDPLSDEYKGYVITGSRHAVYGNAIGNLGR